MTPEQLQWLRAEYKTHPGKDVVHVLANRARDVFPKGIGRAAVRAALAPADVLDIGYLDIETSLMKGYFWSPWKPVIPYDNILEESVILCWSAAWLNEDPNYIFGDSLHLSGERSAGWHRDDRALVEDLWDFLDRADIIIGHNVDRFDLTHINTLFLRHGMPPTSPYQIIDTYKVSKRKFRMATNKLGDCAKRFSLRHEKLDTTLELWRQCADGNPAAFEEMYTYNKGDIATGIDYYLLLRPYVPSHPPVAPGRSDVCQYCGSLNLEPIDGAYRTQASVFPLLRCTDCGGIVRDYANALKGKHGRTIAR